MASKPHHSPRIVCSRAQAAFRRSIAAAMVVLLIGMAAPDRPAAQTAQPPPALEEATCDMPGLSPDVAPRVRCGTVVVPRDYRHSDRGSFRLAVVVVRSARQPALPDPVVYISGGPGSPLTVYTDYQARHPYAADRDLILVDQRGMGRSEPRLCPNAAGNLRDVGFAAIATPGPEAQARRRSAYMACRDEVAAQGLDLNDFGTAVTAADFDRVRVALGIERWNVVGESYGTTVAMTLMARDRGAIRSAVLDSVYPPDSMLPIWSARVAAARAAFFRMCDADTACRHWYPGLAKLYAAALDRLGRTPMMIPVPPQLRAQDNRMLLSASPFAVIVDHILYYPTGYPGLPRLIATVHDGKSEEIAAAVASIAAEYRDQNISAHAAVECRDRPHERGPLPADADALDKTDLYGICANWSEPGPSPVIPVGTTIPTLVLAGEFDPNASPEISRRVASRIGQRARWIEFPFLGHNVRHFSACGTAIVAAFIDHPDGPVDTSCIGRTASIQFLPP